MDAVLHMEFKNHHHESPLTANGSVAGEKLGVERFELPRIYISLSRKEKEEDFLAMKGTKLPQRPKKRTKIVDKSLQVRNQPPEFDLIRFVAICFLLMYHKTYVHALVLLCEDRLPGDVAVRCDQRPV
jgi:hypothetical protein